MDATSAISPTCTPLYGSFPTNSRSIVHRKRKYRSAGVESAFEKVATRFDVCGKRLGSNVTRRGGFFFLAACVTPQTPRFQLERKKGENWQLRFARVTFRLFSLVVERRNEKEGEREKKRPGRNYTPRARTSPHTSLRAIPLLRAIHPPDRKRLINVPGGTLSEHRAPSRLQVLIHKGASLHATTAKARFCRATIVERGRFLSGEGERGGGRGKGRDVSVSELSVGRFSRGILIRNRAAERATENHERPIRVDTQ